MSNDAMLKRAKELVVNYFNDHVEITDNKKITEDDVFVVWFCKALQNWKALVSFYVGQKMGYDKTKMSIPEWLRKDKERVPAIPVDPEVKKAIQRYKDHFGKFDIDMVYFRPFEEIAEIIDYCIKMDICYQELYPREPNAIY